MSRSGAALVSHVVGSSKPSSAQTELLEAGLVATAATEVKVRPIGRPWVSRQRQRSETSKRATASANSRMKETRQSGSTESSRTGCRLAI